MSERNPDSGQATRAERLTLNGGDHIYYRDADGNMRSFYWNPYGAPPVTIKVANIPRMLAKHRARSQENGVPLNGDDTTWYFAKG